MMRIDHSEHIQVGKILSICRSSNNVSLAPLPKSVSESPTGMLEKTKGFDDNKEAHSSLARSHNKLRVN